MTDFLCKIGLHKWKKSLFHKTHRIEKTGSSLSIGEYESYGRRECTRCGKTQTKEANGYGGSFWFTNKEGRVAGREGKETPK